MERRNLNPSEKLRAAYAVLILGVATQDVAALLGVNLGRVSEAVDSVKKAIGWPV